jgi:SAM-dependent methyltransferase
MREKNIQAFEDDIEHNEGYVYTTNAALSTRWAQERLSRAVREMIDLKGLSVIDVGCGDGTYTVELLAAEPAYVLGTDASQKVVDFAKGRIPAGTTNIEFRAMEIYDLQAIGREFDVAIARSVLHHLYDAERGVQALMTLSKEVLVVEPNGYSPILKVFERTRRYHREHEEKSYPPSRIDRWLERAGGDRSRSAIRRTGTALLPQLGRSAPEGHRAWGRTDARLEKSLLRVLRRASRGEIRERTGHPSAASAREGGHKRCHRQRQVYIESLTPLPSTNSFRTW